MRRRGFRRCSGERGGGGDTHTPAAAIRKTSSIGVCVLLAFSAYRSRNLAESDRRGGGVCACVCMCAGAHLCARVCVCLSVYECVCVLARGGVYIVMGVDCLRFEGHSHCPSPETGRNERMGNKKRGHGATTYIPLCVCVAWQYIVDCDAEGPELVGKSLACACVGAIQVCCVHVFVCFCVRAWARARVCVRARVHVFVCVCVGARAGVCTRTCARVCM